MIIRGAVMSEERVCVGESRRSAERARSTETVEMLAGVQYAGAPAVASAVPAPERPLDLARVLAFLADCDEADRSACAAALAPDIDALAREACEAARHAGETRAVEEVRAREERALALLERIVAESERTFASGLEQLAGQCSEIVAEAFTRIAGRSLAGADACEAMVREVLQRVKEGREVIVRVAPEDLPHLEAKAAQLATACRGRSLELQGDARVELGGCIVESRDGTLDGRLDVQLRGLFETLRRARTPDAAAP